MHDHVHNTIKGCAPILYALRILRARGMNQPELHTVNQAVITAKLLYAAPACWGLLHRYRPEPHCWLCPAECAKWLP